MVRLLSLRDACSILRGALLPAGQRHGRPALGLCDVRGRLPHPSLRRRHLRAHRRSRGAQVHLPRHHLRDGPVDVRRRPAADLQHANAAVHRSRSPASGGPHRSFSSRCACCRAWRSAANTAAPRPTLPSMPAPGERGYATSWIQTTATIGFFLSLFVIGACRFYLFDAKAFAEWGWRIPFLVSLFLLIFSVYIRLKLNESPIWAKMKEEGKGLEAPADRLLLQAPQQQVCAAGAAGSHRRPGRRLVHGAVLRPVLPDDDPQGRPAARLYDGRPVAAYRHAVLRGVRLAERQDRAAEDHPGRLPDRRRSPTSRCSRCSRRPSIRTSWHSRRSTR